MINAKTDHVLFGCLCAAGFAAFLLAPLLSVYVLGAFVTWDLTWIADESMQTGRITTGVIQGIWLLAISIGASAS